MPSISSVRRSKSRSQPLTVDGINGNLSGALKHGSEIGSFNFLPDKLRTGSPTDVTLASSKLHSLRITEAYFVNIGQVTSEECTIRIRKEMQEVLKSMNIDIYERPTDIQYPCDK